MDNSRGREKVVGIPGDMSKIETNFDNRRGYGFFSGKAQ